MIEKLLDHFIVMRSAVLSFAERAVVEDTEGLTFCDRRECCRRRRFDQDCRFRFDQGAPNECSGQFTIGTTPLNWLIPVGVNRLMIRCGPRSREAVKQRRSEAIRAGEGLT